MPAHAPPNPDAGPDGAVCAHAAGPGLHSGALGSASWVRAPGYDGLRWGDLALGPDVAIRARGHLATDLYSPHDARVWRTAEHWLAAAVGLGLGGLRLSASGPEAPACGGSAADMTAQLRAAHVAHPLPALRRWSPPAPCTVRRKDAVATWRPPAPDDPPGALRVRYRIRFAGYPHLDQAVTLDLTTPDAFWREVASARTFAAAATLEAVRIGQTRGIGAGLQPGDGLVAGPNGWLSGAPLRWHNEAARHKVLDLIGDLGTLGIRPQGDLDVSCGGHALHRALARAVAPALRVP